MDLQIGEGFSQNENAAKAAEEASKMAKRQTGSDRLDMAMVLTTPHYNAEKVFEIVKNSLNQTRIFGGTTAGIIVGNALHRYGVAVFTFRSDSVKMQPVHALHLDLKDLNEAGIAFVKETGSDFGQKDQKFLLFFFDGLLENISDFSTGIQKELGGTFPVIAAGNSDAFRFSKTAQYHDQQSCSSSACGVIFGGDITIHAAQRHGWKPLGKPRPVKKAKKNIIEKIGNAPAMQLYEEFFQGNLGALKNDVYGSLNGRYPLGIPVKHSDEYIIRNVMDILEDGSIVCQDAVREGSEIHIMIGNKSSCLQSAAEAAQNIKKSVKDKPIHALFIFESSARWQILKHSWNEELKAVTDILGNNFPILGMLTYGEIFNPGILGCPGQNSPGNGNILLTAVAS